MINQANKTKTKWYIQAHTYIHVKYMHRPMNVSYNTQQFFQACFPVRLLKTLPKCHAMEEALLVSAHLYRNCCYKPHTVSTLSTRFYKRVLRLWKQHCWNAHISILPRQQQQQQPTQSCTPNSGCVTITTNYYHYHSAECQHAPGKNNPLVASPLCRTKAAWQRSTHCYGSRRVSQSHYWLKAFISLCLESWLKACISLCFETWLNACLCLESKCLEALHDQTAY